MTVSSSFRVVRRRGDAPTLFGPAEFEGAPTVVVQQVTRPALVLGSTQPVAIVRADAAASAGVDVVRRRSGGGAVLVEPDGVLWVDVFVPAGHELWEADVGRAFWWLGDVWARTVSALGVDGAVVHRGGLVTSPWSRLVCFAGLGPGEVTVDGRKVVGMAQRRTREGALFQCALALTWRPERMLQLLESAVASSERRLASSERPLASSERPLTSSERPLQSSERPLASSERSLPSSERPLTSLERSLALFEWPLESFEQALTSLERMVRPLERSLEECALAFLEHLPGAAD